jgi:hypothetical protein
MTFVELVNNVLRRLREDEVVNVSQTSYAKLMGDFVNDAKTIVESAFEWSANNLEITVNATSASRTYALTGSGVAVRTINAINDTSDTFLRYETPTFFDKQYNMQEPLTGSPVYFTYRGFDGNGDTLIEVYPVPDDNYTLLFNIVKDPVDLVEDTDSVLIPHQPIIQLAYAMALRERGETGGQSGAEQFAVADAFLSDAIALDASKNPEKLLWRTV